MNGANFERKMTRFGRQSVAARSVGIFAMMEEKC